MTSYTLYTIIIISKTPAGEFWWVELEETNLEILLTFAVVQYISVSTTIVVVFLDKLLCVTPTIDLF